MADERATPVSRHRVLLIGWDAADWAVLNPMLDAGRMPHLARLVAAGVVGNLASLAPCLSPLLWTSVATGKTADKHGILGFVEATADGMGTVPTPSRSRRCKALWNLLGERGLHSCVIAWLVSDPAEAIPGVYVSERLLGTLVERPEQCAALPAGCVHPERLTPFVAALRLHPGELTAADLAPLLPSSSEIDLRQDPRPPRLAQHYARCATVHAVATAAMTAEPWDFFAVYYEMLDRVGHDFMPYRAPPMAGVSEEDQRRYGGAVEAVYEFHDALLGRLLELAGAETTVILLSDHGFQAGARRPPHRPRAGVGVAADGADWHRPLGVLALRGPGLRCDERLYGASLLDIAPTVLTLFGLPVGLDMDGRVLLGAFAVAPTVATVASWEDGPWPRQPAPVAVAVDAAARAVAVQQLVALGYLAADAAVGSTAALTAGREALFNLATVHLHHGRPATALPLFGRLCELDPCQARYEISRLHALSRLGRQDEVLAHDARLRARGLGCASLDLLAARALAARAQEARALERLQQAAEREPGNPVVHVVTGSHHQGRGRTDLAAAGYRRALALDPTQAEAHSGLAQLALNQADFETALEHALASLREVFWNPLAQYRLGLALEGLGELPRARLAYEHALSQAPDFGEARYRLAILLERAGDLPAAHAQRQVAFGFAPASPATGDGRHTL